MKKKFFPILFIAALILLILFQRAAVMPFVNWVASSSAFMEETGDEGSRIAATTDMTSYAFTQCNKYIKEDTDAGNNIIFPIQPLQSWSLGNYKYLINAEIEIMSEAGQSSFKRYACQIEYENGADQQGVMDSENWDVTGLSGLSGL